MSVKPASLSIPSILHPENVDRAAELLRAYMGLGANPPYAGASFETIGAEWSHPGDAHDVTPADVVALATLSVEVRGPAAIDLLGARGREATGLLRQIPTDLDLVDAEDEHIDDASPLGELWRLLRRVPGMGPTRTSKLLARKRPRLVPVYDSVIEAQLGLRDSVGFWAGLRNALQAESAYLDRHLQEIRKQAGLAEQLSTLRVFDIVVWMDGQGTNGAGEGRSDEE